MIQATLYFTNPNTVHQVVDCVISHGEFKTLHRAMNMDTMKDKLDRWFYRVGYTVKYGGQLVDELDKFGIKYRMEAYGVA